MAGNHSRAWHDANNAVADAERDLTSAEKHDADKPGKIRTAADALTAAKDKFREIDRSSLAYDSE